MGDGFDENTNTNNQNGYCTDKWGTVGSTNDGNPPSSHGIPGIIHNSDGSRSYAQWNGTNQAWEKLGE